MSLRGEAVILPRNRVLAVGPGWSLLSALAALSIWGCSQESVDPDTTFEEKVQPIFQEHCWESCHVEDGYFSELLLGDAHGPEELIGVPSSQADMALIEPGDPERSYLWHKLNDTHLSVGGEGLSMPYDFPILSAEELDVIEAYILAL